MEHSVLLKGSPAVGERPFQAGLNVLTLTYAWREGKGLVNLSVSGPCGTLIEWFPSEFEGAPLQDGSLVLRTPVS